MKKIYTVKIVSCHGKNTWHKYHNGSTYEAELKIVNNRVVFAVDLLHKINPIDCEVISEKIVEPYTK